MPKLLKYSIFSLLVLIIILLIVPFLIPTDSYKGLLISEAKKATGRDLKIDGSIKLTFLPKPSVILTKLKILSLPEAQDPIILDIDEVSASLSIASLLTGKIVISSIELNKPVIKLETLSSGRGTWEFDKAASSGSAVKEVSSAEEVSKELPFYVEKITIKNGQIEYRKGVDKTNVDNISLEFGIDSLRGPINFASKFSALNQSIEISGKVKEFGDIIPVILDVKVGLNKVSISGDFDIVNASFVGDIGSQGLLKDLNSIFADPKITKNPSQNYKLSASISANKEQIEIQGANLGIGRAEGKANATYSIEKKAGNLSLMFNPGNLSININASESINGLSTNQINITAETIKPLLDALEIVVNLPESFNKKFILSANNYCKGQEIILDDISFALGNVNLNGMLKFTELSTKPFISYDLKTTNGSALISIFKDNIPIVLSEVKVKGSSRIDQNNISTKSTVISAARADITIQGNIDVGQEVKPSLSILIAGDNLKQTIGQLFNKNSLPPIGAFSISTMIDGDLSKTLNIKLNKSNMVFNSNNTIFSGDTILTLNKPTPFISTNLQLSSINLTPSNDVSVGSNAPTKQVLSSNRGYWSDDKIDMSFLGVIDGNFNIAVDKLTKESLVFDNIKTKIQLSNGVMKLESLTGNLYGGTLNGLGQVSNKDIAFKFDLKEARLRNIMSQNNKIKITQGVINCNSDIKTYGTSLYQYMSNLSGSVTLNGHDGKISGFNLKKIVDSLSNPKNLENVLSTFKGSFSGGETQFKNFESLLNIKNGIGDLSSCKLDGDGANVTAKGQINFPRYVMDINASVKLDINAMPPFNVSLYGPIDNPEHKFDINTLQKHLVQNVLSKALDNITKGKMKPQDILNNVMNLGNKKRNNSQEPEQNTNDNRQQDTDQLKSLMKKGIKGLFK
jgi:AsmA protein